MHLQCIATINCWEVTREHHIQKPYVLMFLCLSIIKTRIAA